MAVKLSEITEFIIDTKHNTPEFTEHGYPCIRTPNIGRGYFILENVKYVDQITYNTWIERAIPRTGDLILAREAPVGNVAWIPPGLKPCIGQRTVLIRPKTDTVNSRFLTYLLLGDECQNCMLSMSGGATVAHLNMSDIRALDLPDLPSISTQHKIAAILSAYDDLIENNTRRIKILEEMAQRLYREWFVYFRYPGHEKDELVESELGLIPEGWEEVAVGKMLEKTIGGGWGKENAENDHTELVRIVRGTDFNKILGGNFDDVPSRYITKSTLESRKLKRGDLLVENSVNANSRCVGSPLFITDGILKMLQNDTICASFCKLFRPKHIEYSALLRLHMQHLISEGKMAYYQNVATNGIGNFQSNRFIEKEYLLLPSNLDKRFMLLKKLLSFIPTVYSEKIYTLRRTRDILLPKLISGKIDVSELDIDTGDEM